MSYINILPPACYGLGIVCTIDYAVEISSNQGGFEQRNQVWSMPLRPYDASYAVKTEKDFIAVRDHFHMMRGQTFSFPIQDPMDYRSEQKDSVVMPIPNTVNSFGIFKRYGIEPYNYDRRISRPQPDYLRMLSDTTPLVAGTDPGQYSIDPDNGAIVFVPLQSQDIAEYSANSAGDYVITLGAPFSPNIAIGDLLSIIEVTGAAAGVLNNKRHVVTAVSGAEITIDVQNTGITGSGGKAQIYYEPETLSWSGRFWTEVRYNMKGLSIQAVNKKNDGELLLAADSITMLEVRNEAAFYIPPYIPPTPPVDVQEADMLFLASMDSNDTYGFYANPGFDPIVSVGERVFIDGVIGTVADKINGIYHTVWAVESVGPLPPDYPVAITLIKIYVPFTSAGVYPSLEGTGGIVTYENAGQTPVLNPRQERPIQSMTHIIGNDWQLITNGGALNPLPPVGSRIFITGLGGPGRLAIDNRFWEIVTISPSADGHVMTFTIPDSDTEEEVTTEFAHIEYYIA